MSSIKSVRFLKYKALENFNVSLDNMNILVGANNAGKSTVLSALKALAVAMKTARSRRSERVHGPDGEILGWQITPDVLPISTENIHTDYDETDSRVEFTFSTKRRLMLFFPSSGGCSLIADNCPVVYTPTQFRKLFPFAISYVPTLGPVEKDERLLLERTVSSDLLTHRASRQFRNYWHHFPQNFDEFAELLQSSWPKMDIRRPEIISVVGEKPKIVMFCRESRIDRELFWAGFGFQVWCQMLTHISEARRRKSDLLVLDEPEIYLHPDLQRQLLGMLREIGIDVVLATHSTEIMGEASPSEIVVIDKAKRHGSRLRDVAGVQGALDAIGSIQNITLAQLARTRRVLFTEGDKDFRLIRGLARVAGLAELAAGVGITPVQSEGFDSWEKVKSTAWGLEKILEGPKLSIGAIFDRDYRCEEEVEEILRDLQANIPLAHIHQRKEIENYLLSPDVLRRALQDSINARARRAETESVQVDGVEELLLGVTDVYRHEVFSQRVAHEIRYMKKGNSRINEATVVARIARWFEGEWSSLSGRLAIVPGKRILADFRTKVQDVYGVGLTDAKIVSSFRRADIPEDMLQLLVRIDEFRRDR
jgi:energy-coupling factor transporter ATP-binding protein EcfA2